ncbi:MAG: hypothetical protein QM680_12310 [Luteolibacter sp.]
MSSAAFSHWWTLRETILSDSIPPPAPLRTPAENPAPSPVRTPESGKPEALAKTTPNAPEISDSQRAFYEGMLAEMRKLRTENRDLLDQIAETNRDLMKLEFRVDTHSESFRPLPISEERIETSSDTTSDEDGVLPPRAQAVPLPDPLPSRQR